VFVKIKLPEQLGLHAYAVSTYPDELVLEPLPKKNPGSAYGSAAYFPRENDDTARFETASTTPQEPTTNQNT